MFSTRLHAILGGLVTLDPQSTQIELRMLFGAQVLLRASFKRCQLFKPSAHVHSSHLSARSHLWRLPRVFVPFAGSQHHEALVRAHALHAVLFGGRRNGLQGFKLQSGLLRSLSRDSLLEDSPRSYADGALHLFQGNGGTRWRRRGRTSLKGAVRLE